MSACTDLEECVAGYLDGSLHGLGNLALQKHLDDCAACREFVAAYQCTVRVAKKVLDDERATAEAPENLVQRILASLERRANPPMTITGRLWS